MSFVVLCLCVFLGIDVLVVFVEVYLVNGLLLFIIVGLFDIEVKESKDCVCVVI